MAAAAASPLLPGRDLHIIACQREQNANQRRIIGIRWASQPDLGFPLKGYQLRRRGSGNNVNVTLGIFWLPSTDNWDSFKADAEARKPLLGPYFASIDQENLEHLLPIVRLADPRAPAAELIDLTKAASDYFGSLHLEDAELAWNFWPFGAPPPLADLLSSVTTAPEIIKFYRRRAVHYLLALALRFEYAVLFGLATDDEAPPRAKIFYEVEAAWQQGSCIAQSDAHDANSPCVTSPPAWLIADRAPGTVAHPAFAAWPSWTPPLAFAPADGDGNPLAPEALVPRSPAAFTALTWAEAAPEPNLIGHGPVLYRVGRFDYGAGTAGSLTPPPLPPNAAFATLVSGEDLIRGSTEPHFLDFAGMVWPPLEGHYLYSIRGVNLLGIVSETDTRAGVRHHDDIAPVGPRVRALEGPVLMVRDDGKVLVSLRIDWDAAEDFAGPDVVEFRIAVSWTAIRASTLQVIGAVGVDALHVDLTIANIAEPADTFAGARLSMPGAEFPIVSHGTGGSAAMRVRRVGGRTPAVGETGVVLYPGTPTAKTRIKRLARRPAVSATIVSVDSITPTDLSFIAATAIPLPDAEPLRVYLHLFRESFDAEPLGSGKWRIIPPGDDSPAKEIWDQWILSVDPSTVLAGSPSILFPQHFVEVLTAPSPGFNAGLLEVSVVAADGTTYVASPVMPVADPSLIGLRGNESAPSSVVLSIRTKTAPPVVGVSAWDPLSRIWASSAAIYAEMSDYNVSWAAVPGAVRYEVWRALDSGISGASAAADDHARRILAAAQPEAFEMRSNEVFATSYHDALPGRAPTRAYYRVRAIGLNGIAGDFSPVIGPVYVPDVRRPPAPNLLRARAASLEEGDRTIAIEWIQPGERDGVRYEVQFRAKAAVPAEFAVAGEIAAGTELSLADVYRFFHNNRPPGKIFEYRVVAFRHVADPIDTSGSTMREIASAPSTIQSASSISLSPISPPASVHATFDQITGDVTIAWSNSDHYDSISVRRRAFGTHTYELIAKLSGDTTSYVDADVPVGTWVYQVRAQGFSREGRSADVEVEV